LISLRSFYLDGMLADSVLRAVWGWLCCWLKLSEVAINCAKAPFSRFTLTTQTLMSAPGRKLHYLFCLKALQA
jgi:hypothetical protein